MNHIVIRLAIIAGAVWLISHPARAANNKFNDFDCITLASYPGYLTIVGHGDIFYSLLDHNGDLITLKIEAVDKQAKQTVCSNRVR